MFPSLFVLSSQPLVSDLCNVANQLCTGIHTYRYVHCKHKGMQSQCLVSLDEIMPHAALLEAVSLLFHLNAAA